MSKALTGGKMAQSKAAIAPYAEYGKLIHAWRNEIKHNYAMIEKETGIREQRIKCLEKGEDKPDWKELELLAKYFCISVRDLLPAENDLDRGCKFLRNKDAVKFDQDRGGRLQYTYWNRVMSSMIPNFKPVELLLHLTRREDVVMNRGHFFHQYTQVLHGGPVAFLWQWKGETLEEIFHQGDSWLIPGFVPHAFYSLEPINLGKILAITFGQHLAGDAKQELTLIGAENASRIIEDSNDYYSKGEGSQRE